MPTFLSEGGHAAEAARRMRGAIEAAALEARPSLVVRSEEELANAPWKEAPMTTSEPCVVCHVVPHKLGCPHGAGKVSMDVAVTVSAPPIPEGLCALSGCVLTPHGGPHSWEIVPYTDEALYGRTKENQ